MKDRRFGSIEMPLSVVGIGTWPFGGEWGRDCTVPDVRAILDRARELCIAVLDTAECYGDHASELLIGEAIEGRRDEWFVVTKVGRRNTGAFQRDQLWSPDAVLQQLGASLEALRADRVDLYRFHSFSKDAFANAELWAALAERVRAGRVRHVPISIGKDDDVSPTGRARDIGAEARQVVHNRLDRTPEQHVFPACQRNDLGVLGNVPLASGYRSRRCRPRTTFHGPRNVRWRHEREGVQRKLPEADRIRLYEAPS